MHKWLLIIFLLIPAFLQAQVPLDEIIEDKNEMADAYYGTFKYNGSAFTGEGIVFHDNGKIKSLRSFKDGKYHGYWTEWHDNGNRKFQGNRIQNKGDGITQWWYENGQLKKQSTYELDVEQGVIVQWHPNGHLKEIRYFQDGKAFGGWTTFDKEGNIIDEGDEEHLYYRPFFGNDTAPEGFEETSPSITSDGETLVFARYDDWVKKVPYIALRKNARWEKEQLSFADTIYNLAISPDGNRIVYGTFEEVDDKEIRKVFYVNKVGNGWSRPNEIKQLADISAGYFQIMKDGSIYFFARVPKNGIYFTELSDKNQYSNPQWLSDQVGLPNSDSFSAFLNPAKDRLIVTQAYSLNKFPDRGEIGMYYYVKDNDVWKRDKRIPIGYAWGANITKDNKLVFVRNGNIQYVNLEEIGIQW